MILTTLRLTWRGAAVDEGMRLLEDVLKEVRAFPGCLGAEIAVDVEDATQILVVERWATLEDDLAYLAWRAGEGRVDLAPLLDGPTVLARHVVREDV